MVLVVFAVLVLLFVILPLVTHAVFWILWSAIIGIVLGALGRLVVPGSQPIGVLATICCGWIGALVGGGIARGAGLHHFATILIEIGVSAGLVAAYSTVNRRRITPAERARNVIDV